MLKNRYKISSKKGLEIFNNLNQLDEYKKYFTYQEIIDITDVDPEREPLLFIEYKNMDFYTENDYIQEILKLFSIFYFNTFACIWIKKFSNTINSFRF